MDAATSKTTMKKFYPAFVLMAREDGEVEVFAGEGLGVGRWFYIKGQGRFLKVDRRAVFMGYRQAQRALSQVNKTRVLIPQTIDQHEVERAGL